MPRNTQPTLSLAQLNAARSQGGLGANSLQQLLARSIATGDRDMEMRIMEVLARRRGEDAIASQGPPESPGALAQMYAAFNRVNPFHQVSQVLGPPQ